MSVSLPDAVEFNDNIALPTLMATLIMKIQ
jgi:hypothetical protein